MQSLKYMILATLCLACFLSQRTHGQSPRPIPPQVLKDLQSADAQVVIAAVDEMSREYVDSVGFLDCIIPLLDDERYAVKKFVGFQSLRIPVRRSAGKALKNANQNTLLELSQRLDEVQSEEGLVLALYALREDFQSDAAFDTVSKLATHKHAGVRGAVVITLDALTDQPSKKLPFLTDALSDPAPWVISRGLDRLGNLGQRAQKHLSQIENHLESDLTYFVSISNHSAVPRAVSADAARALARIGVVSSEAERILETILLQNVDAGSCETHCWAATAILIAIPKRKDFALYKLETLLSDENSNVRECLEAIACAGPKAKKLVPKLIKLSLNETYGIWYLPKTLYAVSPLKAEDQVAAMLYNDSESLASAAAETLSEHGANTPEALSGFVQLLKREGSWTFQSAMNALKDLGPEAAPALPALEELLDSEGIWEARTDNRKELEELVSSLQPLIEAK